MIVIQKQGDKAWGFAYKPSWGCAHTQHKQGWGRVPTHDACTFPWVLEGKGCGGWCYHCAVLPHIIPTFCVPAPEAGVIPKEDTVALPEDLCAGIRLLGCLCFHPIRQHWGDSHATMLPGDWGGPRVLPLCDCEWWGWTERQVPNCLRPTTAQAESNIPPKGGNLRENQGQVGRRRRKKELRVNKGR